MVRSYDFRHAPGHLIRRAHQLSVSIFVKETASFDVTPVQFSIMNALLDEPGCDQSTVAINVGFDAATSGSVIGRLEAKGWIVRLPDPSDGRRKLLWATPEGKGEVLRMKRSVDKVQKRLLSPLSQSEAEQFVTLLEKVISGR